MDNNELDRVSELIWMKLFCKENEDKSREEQIELIKPIIKKSYKEATELGRKKALIHIKNFIGKLA